MQSVPTKSSSSTKPDYTWQAAVHNFCTQNKQTQMHTSAQISNSAHAQNVLHEYLKQHKHFPTWPNTPTHPLPNLTQHLTWPGAWGELSSSKPDLSCKALASKDLNWRDVVTNLAVILREVESCLTWPALKTKKKTPQKKPGQTTGE